MELHRQTDATCHQPQPGGARLRVRLNEDGSWLPGEARIRLTITPPFWRTWWFFLLILSAVLIIWLGIRIRVQTIHRQKRALERQCRNGRTPQPGHCGRTLGGRCEWKPSVPVGEEPVGQKATSSPT